MPLYFDTDASYSLFAIFVHIDAFHFLTSAAFDAHLKMIISLCSRQRLHHYFISHDYDERRHECH
jgi:hypothetical protein